MRFLIVFIISALIGYFGYWYYRKELLASQRRQRERDDAWAAFQASERAMREQWESGMVRLRAVASVNLTPGSVTLGAQRQERPWPNGRMQNYILNPDHTPKLVGLEEWSIWFETADRHVAQTDLHDGLWISTVFLGLDHRFGLVPGDPILFETMVFRRPSMEDLEQCRYCTWDEAVAGHQAMIAYVIEHYPPAPTRMMFDED